MMMMDDDDGRTTKPSTPQMRSESDQCIRPSSRSTPDIHQTCKPDEIRRSVTFIQRMNCDVSVAVNNSEEHHIITQSDENEQHVPESNTSSHLTCTFYPSDFRSNIQHHVPPEKTLPLILTSVKDLLSRSPPQDFDVLLSELSTDLIENSPTRDLHPFTVKRSGEDSRDVSLQKSSQLAGNPLSPSWDEMFDDDLEETDVPLQKQHHDGMDLNESVELFEDDEDFLQVSIPDVHTPDEKTSEAQNVTAGQSSPEGPEQNSEVFNCSQDFFSVNFDLGLSFDSEEEEEEAAKEKINTSALNKPKAPVVSSPSRPADDVRMRCAQTPLICEKWSSAVVRPSASTPNRELLSASHKRTAHTSVQKHTSTGYTEVVLLLPVMCYSRDIRTHRRSRVCVLDVLCGDGEDEVFVRKQAHKVNPLSSPQVMSHLFLTLSH